MIGKDMGSGVSLRLRWRVSSSWEVIHCEAAVIGLEYQFIIPVLEAGYGDLPSPMDVKRPIYSLGVTMVIILNNFQCAVPMDGRGEVGATTPLVVRTYCCTG